MKKEVSIVLFSIWVVISGAMLGIGVDIANNVLKVIGSVNLFVIIFLILLNSEKSKK